MLEREDVLLARGPGAQHGLAGAGRRSVEGDPDGVAAGGVGLLDREPVAAVGPVDAVAVAEHEQGADGRCLAGEGVAPLDVEARAGGQLLVEGVLEAHERGPLGVQRERAVGALVEECEREVRPHREDGERGPHDHDRRRPPRPPSMRALGAHIALSERIEDVEGGEEAGGTEDDEEGEPVGLVALVDVGERHRGDPADQACEREHPQQRRARRLRVVVAPGPEDDHRAHEGEEEEERHRRRDARRGIERRVREPAHHGGRRREREEGEEAVEADRVGPEHREQVGREVLRREQAGLVGVERAADRVDERRVVAVERHAEQVPELHPVHVHVEREHDPDPDREGCHVAPGPLVGRQAEHAHEPPRRVPTAPVGEEHEQTGGEHRAEHGERAEPDGAAAHQRQRGEHTGPRRPRPDRGAARMRASPRTHRSPGPRPTARPRGTRPAGSRGTAPPSPRPPRARTRRPPTARGERAGDRVA